MKTRYILGAALIGTLGLAATANASDTQVRFNVHLGIPVHAPVTVLPSPHLYPPVVYYQHPGYHHGHHHYGHHGHHGKHHRHSDSHWRHYDGHRGHGYASAAQPSHHQGGHDWRRR